MKTRLLIVVVSTITVLTANAVVTRWPVLP